MGLVELFVLLAAVSGSSWIVGMVAWLWFRTKRLEEVALGRGDAPQALLTELEELKEALSAGAVELERVNERLDFLERLLSSGEGGEPARQQLSPGTEVEGTGRRVDPE